MKASELIRQLGRLILDHGDQECMVYDDMEFVEMFGVAVGVDDGDRAYCFTLCDPETFESFCSYYEGPLGVEPS